MKALLLPGDEPPSETTLKRQLLFFADVLIVDPCDRAILNKGEISEPFLAERSTGVKSTRTPCSSLRT